MTQIRNPHGHPVDVIVDGGAITVAGHGTADVPSDVAASLAKQGWKRDAKAPRATKGKAAPAVDTPVKGEKE